MTFTTMAIVEARTKCTYVDLMGSALVSQGSVNEGGRGQSYDGYSEGYN